MFTLLASALPVHALIVSARRRATDAKAKAPRDERGDPFTPRDEQA